MRNGTEIPHHFFKVLLPVRQEFGLWGEFLPRYFRSGKSVDRLVGQKTAVDRTRVRIIPLKVVRVDFDSFYSSDAAEFENNPIVPGTPPATRLPTVSHRRSPTRHNKIVHRSKEHIAGGDG